MKKSENARLTAREMKAYNAYQHYTNGTMSVKEIVCEVLGGIALLCLAGVFVYVCAIA